MKLNEAKIKKKRHKSLDPWRLYVPDWSRTSGLLLRRNNYQINQRITKTPQMSWSPLFS